MVNGNGVVGRSQGRQITGPNPGFEGRLHQARNGAETNLTSDEGSHRNLIGRIVYGGGATPRSQGLIGQSQARESLEVRRFEGKLADLGEIELGGRSFDSFGPT